MHDRSKSVSQEAGGDVTDREFSGLVTIRSDTKPKRALQILLGIRQQTDSHLIQAVGTSVLVLLKRQKARLREKFASG
jgi:hypothetical protein